jgi:hypothetical protein
MVVVRLVDVIQFMADNAGIGKIIMVVFDVAHIFFLSSQ